MSTHTILKGSYRERPQGPSAAVSPRMEERSSVTCVLRRKRLALANPGMLLTRADFAAAHGSEGDDVHVLERFAATHYLTINQISVEARTVRLSGTLHDLSAAFGASLELSTIAGETYQIRSGNLSVPAELNGIVVAILGFDQRPIAQTRHQLLEHAGRSSFKPAEVARAYNFPINQGSGQTIALIELGGGYQQADLETYWREVGVGNVSVTAIEVGEGRNSPSGDPSSADGEVALDIEVAGAIAPAARILVYFAANSEQGFLEAINAAIHDDVHKPSVISISWGSPESNWTPQAMNAFNAAFHDAALLGISVCAAAGDSGSADGVADGCNHVDFPASSPWVLSCGGTRLQLSGDKILAETVWNDGAGSGATGGGLSRHFPKPGYQKSLKIKHRGLPDVTGNADPESGYLVVVDRQTSVVGGTSAVAPLWAALIALMNEDLGRNVGWLHPHLYGAAAQQGALHDITEGSNGRYKAAPGWDACTGLGSPNGQAMLAVLKAAQRT